MTRHSTARASRRERRSFAPSLAIALLAMTLLAAACGGGDDVAAPTTSTTTTTEAPYTIVAWLAEASNHQTLWRLVQRASLVDTLRRPEFFTLFAPTDEAFAALGDEQLAELEGDPDHLREVLLNHLVPDRITSEFITGPGFVTASSGFRLDLRPEGDTLLVGKVARVVEPDIEVDNGIIHVVDAVVNLPTVWTLLSEDEQFARFTESIERAGLVDVLDGPGPITVLAPPNAAFDLGNADLADDPELLAALWSYHIIDGVRTAADLQEQGTVLTRLGETLTISMGSDFLEANGVGIVVTDIEAGNGLIHVIDGILFPPDSGPAGGEEGDTES